MFKLRCEWGARKVCLSVLSLELFRYYLLPLADILHFGSE